MALTVTFYRFAKETNSTEIPGYDVTHVTFDNITLKSATSVLSPTILLRYSAASYGALGMTYAYIPAFNRYYFVTNHTYLNGVWAISLSVDVLASYRGAIGNTTQYILRASNEYDGSLTDTLYPIKNGLTMDYMDVPWGWASFANGVFIVGVVNSDDSASGGTVCYYVMTRAALLGLSNYLMSDPSAWLQIPATEISNELSKALVNPTDYIVSVKWLPITLSDLGTGTVTATTTFKFGFYSAHVPSGLYTTKSVWWTVSKDPVTIKKHPQAATRGEYLNASPYTSYILHVPPFGDIPLDSSAMIGATSLRFRVDLDLSTTSAVLWVYSNKGGIESSEIAKARTVIGVDLRMDKIGYDVSNQNLGFYLVGSALLSFASGVFNKSTDTGIADTPQDRREPASLSEHINAWADAIPDISTLVGKSVTSTVSRAINGAQNIMSAYGAALCNVHSAGSVGSFAEYRHPSVYVQCVFATIADEALTDGESPDKYRGRPLCKMRKISTLGGYMSVSDPHIDSVLCTLSEKTMIEQHMANGFWYR